MHSKPQNLRSYEGRFSPDMAKDRLTEALQRERDDLFVRALALAFQRGDHLPAVKPAPKRTRPVPITTKPRSPFAIWEDDNA